MTRLLGQKDMPQSEEHTLLVNSASPVVRHAIGFQASGRPRNAALLIEQVYDPAMLNCQVFGRERMEKFLERSNQLLERVEPEATEK